tara:strand:+ start:762 stop:1025 length:264 start_codon:yes stop_codon:yes gene_type:complete
MNRKFVKENKKPLREWFTNLIAAILGVKSLKGIDKIIDDNPELSKKRTALKKSSKELADRMRKYIADNPEEAEKLEKKWSYYLKRYK